LTQLLFLEWTWNHKCRAQREGGEPCRDERCQLDNCKTIDEEGEQIFLGEISMVLMAILMAPLTLALLLQALHSRQLLRFESYSKIAGGRGGQK